MVVKECFFPCCMPLPSYVHNFHHFNCKFSYLRHWWDSHFGAITWSSFYVLDSYTMRNYSESSLLPFPHLSWVWKGIITNILKWKHGHNCAKCCSVVGYSFFMAYILCLYGIKTTLYRCFPERANVSADQVRILCNNKNIINFEAFFWTALVINNRKW